MHFELLKLLADGKFHSGEILAQELSVSRTAIWKMIPRLQALGLELHSVKGKGYRLFEPLDLLDTERLMEHIPDGVRRGIGALKVLPTIPSTSTYVMELNQNKALDLKNNQAFVCLAEHQSAGKGRRGRTWVSPFGHNLYLTIVREFPRGVGELEGLSLIVGLAVVRVLTRNGFQGLGIKWPNDILWQGRKLAGILLEVSGDPTGLSQVLVGLGLNVKVSQEQMREVEQEWVDLISIRQEIPERNRLAAELISEILLLMNEFEQKGFSAYKDEWDNLDALRNQDVELKTASSQAGGIRGKVLGVNEQGGLMLQTESGIETFHGGELSPRMVSHENT